MSARLSTGLPFACSGLMYAAVPRIVPIPVTAGDVNVAALAIGSSGTFANPKSRILTVPSDRTLMLAGFKSR